MWNPFARWRQQTNCGYYMPSYIPSYTSSICNYPPRQYQPWTAASYSVMNEAFDNYPYYGQQQMPFKPFMIGKIRLIYSLLSFAHLIYPLIEAKRSNKNATLNH